MIPHGSSWHGPHPAIGNAHDLYKGMWSSMTAASHTIAALEQEIVELREEVASLRQTLAWFRKQIFGSTSERRLMADPSEMGNLFGEAAAAGEEAEVEEVVRRKRRRKSRDGCVNEEGLRFDDTVPVKTIHVALSKAPCSGNPKECRMTAVHFWGGGVMKQVMFTVCLLMLAVPSEAEDDAIIHAAEQGDAEAQYTLGRTYTNSGDTAEAFRWYHRAAEQGHASAQFRLGHMYATGRGVSEDDGEAFKWTKLAAEQEHVRAQYRLARMYDYGRGVSEDDAKAVEWYRRAALQGDVRAQYQLARMYDYGRGVSEDDAKAVEWYRRAALQGNVRAQYRLARMYDSGRGVSEDDAKAAEWFTLVAERGLANAQYRLGVMHAEGTGVSKDDAEAFKVESRTGAPTLGSGGTTPLSGIPSLSFRSSVRLPWPRFQSPLIKPDVRISRIRLSGEIMPSRSAGPWTRASRSRGRSHRSASRSGSAHTARTSPCACDRATGVAA